VSKHESALTRAFWDEVGGTLIEEFCAVRRSSESGRRMIDGIILVDAEKRIAVRGEGLSPTGHDVVCVQTKATRATITLVGQAIFTPLLISTQWQPRSIRSVAIYTDDDPILSEIMDAHRVESRIVSTDARLSSTETPKPNKLIDGYAAVVSGTVTRRVTLVPKSPGQPRHRAEAVIVEDDGPIDPENPDLAGRSVTALVTTVSSPGMYVAGRALVMLDLLRRLRVPDPRAVILAPRNDAAIARSLAEFPAITIETAPFISSGPTGD
jgi:hypothetical protein